MNLQSTMPGLGALALVLALCGGLSACAARPAAAPGNAPFTVKVIGFNDYHGHLESPGTFGPSGAVPAEQRPTVGGAAAIAAQVAGLKRQHPLHVVVAAGDLVGASPLVSSRFHDEPAVEVLNRIGLEFSAVGNHEFDHGWRELLRLQHGGCRPADAALPLARSCQGAAVGTPVPFEGARFQWLAANVVRHDTGATLLPAYGVKTFQGVPMAFVGLTLREAPTLVTPTGVAGLTFGDEAAAVNALVPVLKAQGIEAIGLLVHQGGAQVGALADLNGCDGELLGSELARIVGQLDDAVDFVLSGHTHAAYNCLLRNARGRAIPVTSASALGRVLTELDVTLDPATRDVVAVLARNQLVRRDDPARPAGDGADVARLVAGYKALAQPLAERVVGSIAAGLPSARVDAACNMPAGDLLADAQLAATQAPDLGGAQLALVNGGGVRNPGFTFASSPAGEGDGNVTYGEAFTVQPFGNSLVTMTLTARDLKDVLEQQFAGCLGQSATATRLALPSAGFSYRWDGAQPCGARIRDVQLRRADGADEVLVDGSGRVLAPARSYRVTVNSFMAEGGDGHTALLRGTDRLGGAQDLDALVAYLGRFRAPLRPYRAAEGAPRLQRIGGGTACPAGANTNP